MREADHSWKGFRALITTPDLPALGPTARAGRLPLADLYQKIERFMTDGKPPVTLRACLRSAALLWHDYLDESHNLSQNIHTADGSFLHAIMHRREPDYSNAKYWFHRAGPHRCFPQIAARAADLLATSGQNELAALLAPRGSWDPFGFVDACEEAADRPLSDQRIQTLMAIQQIEFDSLLADLFSK